MTHEELIGEGWVCTHELNGSVLYTRERCISEEITILKSPDSLYRAAYYGARYKAAPGEYHTKEAALWELGAMVLCTETVRYRCTQDPA